MTVLNASFALEEYGDGEIEGVVTLDPDAPVLEVTMWSDEGVFGPAEEVEPGVWVAEAETTGRTLLRSDRGHIASREQEEEGLHPVAHGSAPGQR